MQTIKATAPLLDGSILQEEIDLELRALDQGVIRYRRQAQEAIRRGEGANLKPAERLLIHWFETLEALITDERKAFAAGKPGTKRVVTGPVLALLKPAQLAVLTMHECVSACMSEPEGVPFNRLSHAVGRAVFSEIHRRRLRVAKKLKDLEKKYKKLSPKRVNWWAKKNLEDPFTSKHASHCVGDVLINLLINSASNGDYMEDVFDPSFSHSTIRRHGKKLGILTMSPTAFKIIEDGHAMRWHLRPRYLPMIVTPYPWTDDAQGGYVRIRTPFISKPTGTQKKALAKANLSKVHDALYAIGATAWRLNRRVAKIQRAVWESGGGILGIPHANDKPRLFRPDAVAKDPVLLKAWKKEAAKAYRENIRRQSDRAEFLQTMGVADLFESRPAFWYPHQLDFRGRCYPIPAHLNHQGDDVCRGLLEFADQKPVDDDSWRWVLIHAANCFGVDKVSYNERLEWAIDNMPQIAKVNDDPLATDWWHKADKPWEFLAACFAIFSGEAASRLPIQLDGTCNGLQHYAALGRDAAGAAVVNMLPSGKPSDIYSRVAAEVQNRVDTDAAAGNPHAVKIQKNITRKVCKPPTMTTVYGVTLIGAREQIHTALVEAGVPNDGLYDTSRYLSSVVMECIGRVCQSAGAIMQWLRRCAEIISDSGLPVAWNTPLGLPVVQPYRNYRDVEVETLLQRIKLRKEDESQPVKRRKQIDGIAPNFVHSIDATHMMMTAMECHRRNIAFAEVHDSYWTHAATATEMGVILREQFIALHSKPILQDLVEQFRAQLPGVEFPDPPPAGDFDLNQVLGSAYFFS